LERFFDAELIGSVRGAVGGETGNNKTAGHVKGDCIGTSVARVA
jgi:hypothetical protein